MNITQLKESLPVLMRNNVVPLIWGYQGLGKTQVVKQVAEQQRVGFVHLHLATQEVGDLVGLLVHNADGTVKHARPEWLPTEGKGILFLDEINRAHPDVIQAMFSLITSRTIHTHVLPAGWSIVAAANYQNESFTVTDTSDAAWLSRFCHLHFEPTKQEFVTYAEGRGAELVADFIMENEELLEKRGARPEIPITPDRRSWLDMVAKLDDEDMDKGIRTEVYCGILGLTAGSRYINWQSSKERKIRIRDILRDYDNVRARVKEMNKKKETRFDALNTPLEELEARLQQADARLEPKEIENLKRYYLDLPLELVVQHIRKIGKFGFIGKDSLLSDNAFNAKLLK